MPWEWALRAHKSLWSGRGARLMVAHPDRTVAPQSLQITTYHNRWVCDPGAFWMIREFGTDETYLIPRLGRSMDRGSNIRFGHAPPVGTYGPPCFARMVQVVLWPHSSLNYQPPAPEAIFTTWIIQTEPGDPRSFRRKRYYTSNLTSGT